MHWIAQATQSVTIWSAEVMAAVSAGIVLIIGTAVAAIVALIKAGTAKVEAKLGQAQALHATATAEGASEKATLAIRGNQQTEQSVTRLAEKMPPPGASQ